MTCEDWPIVWPCDVPPAASDEQQAAATSAAQSLLWARTGRRLGLCTIAEEYTPVAGGGCGRPWMSDDLVWHNGGGRGSECCAIHLVSQPVQIVDEVRLYGQVLDPSGYRVQGARLMRVGACWPTPDDDCSPPPVTVTYRWGVPIHGSLWGLVGAAMGEVAFEFLQAMCGGTCRLPSTATSVTRQGVTIDLGGSPDDVGLLGLPIADSLIGTVNPGRARQRSRVYSPDMARRNRVPLTQAPGATNVGGVSTVTLPDAYVGDAYAFTMTFPNAGYLSGGPGTVDAQVKVQPGDVSPVATFTPTIVGAVLTLTLNPVGLAPGSYWTDVSVGGITWLKKTRLVVHQQVSDG